jgi:hypothetical protein
MLYQLEQFFRVESDERNTDSEDIHVPNLWFYTLNK